MESGTVTRYLPKKNYVIDDTFNEWWIWFIVGTDLSRTQKASHSFSYGRDEI